MRPAPIPEFKVLDISKLIFVDIETVAKQRALHEDDPIASSVSWKYRDYQSGDELPFNEVQEEFKKKAGLHSPYNKVACITIGYIFEGALRVKTLSGEERDIVEEFYSLTRGRILVGYNSDAFDLSILKFKAWKYGIEVPAEFRTFGKKPWDLGMEGILKNTTLLLDMMPAVRGIHGKNFSLDDCCIEFSIPTPKVDLKGSEVSYTYWNHKDGLERIISYCELDVLATANLFLFLIGEPIIDFYRGEDEAEIEELTLVEKIYASKDLSDMLKDELRDMIDSRPGKLTKKDKANLAEYLLALVDSGVGFMKDKQLPEKEEDIQQFINLL